MKEDLQEISDLQKEAWNNVSNAWKKWNDFTMNFLKPTGEAIIKALSIQPNDVVLDLASGTGEPAFTIAAIAKNGRVYATDLSEEMLNVARDYAHELNITNIEFKTADGSDLPFQNDFFDKISCRMGFMFFPDMQLAANEMFRVCKIGGKAAISVWAAPEKNDWSTTVTKALSKHIEIPKQPTDAPGMFRCVKSGLVNELFEKVGFKNVKEETISGKVDFETPENYWLNRTEMSETTISLLKKADDVTINKIKQALIEDCNSMLVDGRLIMNYAAIIISAEK
ncbi:MAG: class I SAM-dependent methyltransferase [Sphingobacteriales bacterium]|nr:class I SAM-dependent methyltransferase [Sphingobacteriales bacterium]